MNYRHEIDGLRAIAVMGVILYHLGLTRIGAGYAGVDVFFVISGFLIGGIIARQRAQGTFRYRDFYARRARRILPALYVVILCSIVVGWFTLMPQQLRYFGGGAISTLFFASNIWFFELINYFNPSALKAPLIHTWSLAVEEQFYFIVPLLFGFLWRFGKRTVFAVFLALGILSLLTAIITNADHPMAAFYMIHTRAWELLSGVLAALAFPQLKQNDRINGNLSNLGLLLILGGLILIPAHVPWPGAWTLIPVTGTILVLLFGQSQSLAYKVLTLKPLTMIGLISYSAYLWHQPMISFAGTIDYHPTGGLKIIAFTIAILGLSWLSWRFVEQPFRNKNAMPKAAKAISLILASIAIATFAIGAHITKGYPDRVPPDVRAIISYNTSSAPEYKKCLAVRSNVSDQPVKTRCVHGADVEPSIVVWGDSHAAKITHSLGGALAPYNMALRELTLSSCQPIPNMLNYGQKRAPACTEFNADVLDYLLATPSIEAVVLNAAWNSYFQNADIVNWLEISTSNSIYSYPADQTPNMSDTARKAAIKAELIKTIKALTDAGKTVILLQSTPRPGFNIPNYYGHKVWRGEILPPEVEFPSSLFSQATLETRQLLADAAQKGGAILVNTSSALCSETGCRVIQGNELLFSDAHHLSLPGVARVIPLVMDALQHNQ